VTCYVRHSAAAERDAGVPAQICLRPAPVKFSVAVLRGPARTAASAGAAITFLFATGCSVSAPGAEHPAKPMRTASAQAGSPPSAAALTPRQQVIAAYKGFLAAVRQASDTRNPRRARTFLAPYLAPAAAAELIGAFEAAWQHGEIAYGAVIPHVLGVHIAGNRAVLHDCQDGSHAGLQNARTGRVVPGTLGKADFDADITFELVGRRWLYISFIPLDARCTP